MKHVFLIIVFCFSKIFAQVSPPDLRCLQVDATGNVTLSWIPPGDPGNVFDSYEIYNSTSLTGPYAVVGTVSSIGTSTFMHLNAGAQIQSRYYYIKSKFGAGGTSVSGSSDTLRTIFLNLNNSSSAIALPISYNNLHQPKLASSAGTFSILKEYPIGSWNTFAVTPGLNYADTLSVCQASINYQITLLDFSGCLSTSNIQGGTFSDKKKPDKPVIDSISVLPNGDIILAWEIPADEDIAKYRIYENITTSTLTSTQIIDTVYGRNNTSYIFTTAGAGLNAIALFVAAIDSCNNIGGFDSLPRTMDLQTKYNACNYQSVLTWNPYRNMPGDLLEYRIYYSENGSPFSFLGATGDTKFTHDNVAGDKNICYYVRAFNKTKTISSSSNRSCFFSRQGIVSEYLYMRRASILYDNTAEVKLLLDTAKVSYGIEIYRSDDGVSFKSVGSLASDTLSPDYTFYDKTAEPNKQSYYYKAAVKDSCGNPRTVSNISKTILLKVVDDRELLFTKHLSWSPYSGFMGGISGYNIYRVIDGNTSRLVGYAGINGSSYTDELEDEAPNGSKIDYMVEAVEGLGNIYGFMEKSSSNPAEVYVEDRIFVPEAFAPNGLNKIWLPVTHFVDKHEYHVRVFNRWGAQVFETSDDTVGWGGDEAPGGVYAYLISYKNSRGEYQELKGTLLLYK